MVLVFFLNNDQHPQTLFLVSRPEMNLEYHFRIQKLPILLNYLNLDQRFQILVCQKSNTSLYLLDFTHIRYQNLDLNLDFECISNPIDIGKVLISSHIKSPTQRHNQNPNFIIQSRVKIPMIRVQRIQIQRLDQILHQNRFWFYRISSNLNVWGLWL